MAAITSLCPNRYFESPLYFLTSSISLISVSGKSTFSNCPDVRRLIFSRFAQQNLPPFQEFFYIPLSFTNDGYGSTNIDLPILLSSSGSSSGPRNNNMLPSYFFEKSTIPHCPPFLFIIFIQLLLYSIEPVSFITLIRFK